VRQHTTTIHDLLHKNSLEFTHEINPAHFAVDITKTSDEAQVNRHQSQHAPRSASTPNMSLTNCRFYEEKFPEIDSFVMVNVKQVWMCGLLEEGDIN